MIYVFYLNLLMINCSVKTQYKEKLLSRIDVS